MLPRVHLGRHGERLAVRALVRAGYVVLGRNLRVGRAEIDVLCVRAGALIVVEVKTHSGCERRAWEAFDRAKVERLEAAGRRFLAAHGRPRLPVRLALVLVDLGPPLAADASLWTRARARLLPPRARVEILEPW